MKRLLVSTLLLAFLWTAVWFATASAEAKGVKGFSPVRTASGSDRVEASLLTRSPMKTSRDDFSDRVVSSLLTRSLIKISRDDFGAVVKVVEEFYGVKHKGLPFLAKAGIKTATTVARLSGGSRKKLAEAGSVKVAFFEEQELKLKGGIADFRASLKATLAGRWLPFVQVLSLNDAAQTYVFLRDAGPKYTVLVVTIEERDALVVQVNLTPETLAMLMQNPNEMGKEITDDATKTDDQE